MAPSIKDVARLAGVSTATVSRVLSGGTVSDELRLRVEDAVRTIGYRPNLSARRLRSQHSQTIGLIVSDVTNPFFTAVARAVEDAAYDAGMRVILCNSDEDPDKEGMYLRLMQEERVTGLILAPTRQALQDFHPLDFPVVLIDRSGPAGTCDSVVLDNAGACAVLVEHLAAQGYRRIGGLFGNTSTTGRERHQGYRDAMAARGLKPDPRFIAPQAEFAETEVRSWLASPDRPQALVASNGQILLGTMRALLGEGWRVPEDMAVAGFDNESWTGLVAGGLTVIEQPVREIGRHAMALLFDRLHTPDLAARKVVLAGRCVIRNSSLMRPTGRA